MVKIYARKNIWGEEIALKVKPNGNEDQRTIKELTEELA